MTKKIKHTIAYIILAVWAGFIIYGASKIFWGGVIQPLIEIGLVKSLIFLVIFIGAVVLIFVAMSVCEKLIDWLLEE